MLTRAFLLLLAMMTGLSAAQAADVSRPASDQAAVTKSITQIAKESANLCAARAALVRPLIIANAQRAIVTVTFDRATLVVAPTACVHRSDRSRQ
jgi:hypothetical protein